MKASKVFKFIGFTLLRIGLIILVLFITMTLWNWLIPELFHGPVISIWQTTGLIVLSKIFFSGIVPGGERRHHDKWHNNFRNGEHHLREEWWKRYNDNKKDTDSPSTAV